ncbi:MAG: UDP-N-acetylmuramate dehydrogenase [Candidatus Pacebacteria bacterium]|nr:UDP-N-acetylmuramate dehydrogenase [Candidatus Paceibacterota bacterium]
MENRFQELKDVFPGMKSNISLRDNSTFKIGGMADYFYETGDSEELKSVIKFCKDKGIDFSVIGGGSNILFSDNGYRGLVIVYKNSFGKFDPVFQDDDKVYLKIDASVLLSEAVIKISNAGYSGFEWAVGIPGTIGGAINGNAGAFGGSISDNIIEVSTYSVGEGEKVFSKEECDFRYRSTIFKKTQKHVILSGVFSFVKEDNSSVLARVKANIQKRAEKQPKHFSAGSIFKNYEGRCNRKLYKKYPELEKFSENELVPAGYLIDRCNLKGMRIGDAQIDQKNGNFIVNVGNAKADNVVKLIHIIKKEVNDRFGILLDEEIKYIGEFK